MPTRILAATALIVALVGCSSPTAAPTTPASNGSGGATPTAAGPTLGGATSTPAAGTATPAAGNTGGSGGAGTVAGTWTGTWTKPAGGGAITLQLQQAGPNVSGTVTMAGSVCIPAATALTGTNDGANVVLTVNGSGFQAILGGTVNGNAMTGTLTASCSLGSATGTWQVTRT